MTPARRLGEVMPSWTYLCCVECGSPLIRDPAAYDRGPHSYCLLCDADVWTWEEMDRAKRRAREWGRAMGMEWATPAAAESEDHDG